MSQSPDRPRRPFVLAAVAAATVVSAVLLGTGVAVAAPTVPVPPAASRTVGTTAPATPATPTTSTAPATPATPTSTTPATPATSTAPATPAAAPAAPSAALSVSITNGVRYDTSGNRIDAHDGQIQVFGGTYYWYGTSYRCGYTFSYTRKVFCGFNSYSSTDLVNWRYEGKTFDPFGISATGTNWQIPCGYGGDGCYNTFVVYNPATAKYVQWVNSYDAGTLGTYHVLTSSSPVGPFVETAAPELPYTNMGADNIFVDTSAPSCRADPTTQTCPAYLSFTLTGSQTNYDIGIVQLTSNYASTTGRGTAMRLGLTRSEPPSLFRANDRYYMLFGYQNCAYCGGTRSQYLMTPTTATSPLAGWPGRSAVRTISADSNGGQPNAVTPIPTTDNGGVTYLQQTDQWVGTPITANGDPTSISLNQTLATQQWEPLSFNSDGTIAPLPTATTFTLNLASGRAGSSAAVASSTYVALAQPARLVDTRAGSGSPYAGTTIGAGQTLTVQIGGRARIPVGATAIAFNLTGTGSTATTYLQARSAGANWRPASNLNLQPGQTLAQSTTTPLDAAGRMDLYNNTGSVDVLVDVVGYFVAGTAGGGYVPLTSSTVVDTRRSGAPLQPGSQRVVPTAPAGVPTDASAVVLNVTASGGTKSGFFSVKAGSFLAPPATSTLNFRAGQTISNRVVVPVGTTSIYLYNQAGSADAMVDVTGYYAKAATSVGLVFHPLDPIREIDTSSYVHNYVTSAILPVGNVAAAMLNVTVVSPSAASNLRVAAANAPYGAGADLNYVSGQTASNLVITPTDGGRAGLIKVANAKGQTYVLADLLGWYSAR